MAQLLYEAIIIPALGSPVIILKTMGNYSFRNPRIRIRIPPLSLLPNTDRGSSRAFCGSKSFIAKNPSSVVVFRRLSSFSSALVRYGIFWVRTCKKCSKLEEPNIARSNNINTNLIDQHKWVSGKRDHFWIMMFIAGSGFDSHRRISFKPLNHESPPFCLPQEYAAP